MNWSAKTGAVLFFSVLAGFEPLAAQTAQSITFDAVGTRILGTSPFAIAAEASSGLAVSFTSTTPAVCSTASVMVTLLAAGTCSITASQPGNGSFSAATPVMRSFAVNAANPSGTMTAAMNSPFGAGSGPQSIAVGYFNGDTVPDLVTANRGDNTVTVLLGDGSGGFTAAMNSPFSVGPEPYYVAVGDFNGDGFQDIVTANANGGSGDPGSVTVLLGDGTGGFTAAMNSPFTVGTEPVSLAVGDFNGDGIQDLAVANYGDGTVTILIGNGTGGFTAEGSAITVGLSPYAVAVADFNGDGSPDLAVANSGDNTVTLLLGNGSGAFTAAGSPFAVGSSPASVSVGDFNGDGIPDLAVANYESANVTVLLGNSANFSGASFGFTAASGSPFTVGINPYSVAVGDLNGDGFPDFAVVNGNDSTLSVWLGNGSGGFNEPASGPFPVGLDPASVVLSDFNGDGILDAAAANSNGADVSVLLGGPAATSAVLSTTSALTIPLGQAVPLTLAVTDAGPAFNLPTGTATFLDGMTTLGTATQTTSPYTYSAAALGIGSHTLTANYGGDPRSAISTSNAITIVVEAAQTITFAPLSNVSFGVSPFAISASTSSPLAVTLTSTTPGVCTLAGSTVTIVTGGTCSITASQTGDATYAPAAPVTQSFSVTGAPQTITFDATPARLLGISPFAIAAQASSELPVTLTSTTPAVCKTASVVVTLLSTGSCSITASQSGNANFNPATSVMRSFAVNEAHVSSGLSATANSPAVGTSPQYVATGDFNGDGIPDLVTANGSSNNVTVLLGNGSGGFTAAMNSPFAVGSGPYSVAVGDFNGDGFEDLAVGNFTDSTVTVLLGNGSGGFAAVAGSPFVVGSNPAGVAVGDFNGDGIQDLATANYGANNVTVLLGNGAGGFTAATNSPFTVGTEPVFISVADFNGDGFPDLAVANFGDSPGTVTVLLGNGAGGFTPATVNPFTVGTNPASVVAADFNGDGIPDLATANYGSNNVTVLLGNSTNLTGAFGFTAATNSPYAVGTAPDALAVADFNGDGIPDLAAANFGASTVTVLLGSSTNISGAFGFTASSGSPYTVGSNPAAMVVADFAGDGFADIATADQGGNNVTVLLGVGTTPQTITFGTISGVVLGVAPFTINATASSGLTVSFTSITPYSCTVSGNTVTILAPNSCAITASQSGNATYAAAPPVTQSFYISATQPVTPPPVIPPSPPASLSITQTTSPGEIALGGSVSALYTATGGAAPYTWSGTALPGGVTLNSQTGAVTGLPLQPGNFNFVISVTDSASTPATATLAATMEVLGITTASSLPTGSVGSAYAKTFAAAGGSGTYVFSSSNAPAGLVFSGATLRGTPALPGTYSFQVQVADGSGVTESASFKVVMTAALSLSSSSSSSSSGSSGTASLGEIAFGSSVSGALTASGGQPPYTWSGSSLPAGVTVNSASGALGGSPAQPGNYSFTVQVADAETPPATQSLGLTLQVLGLTTSPALPAGTTTAAYSQTFSAAGGTAPYTFSSPNAPPGLSFSGATLSGTDTTVGSYSLTVKVVDASGFATSAQFSLLVTGPSTTQLSINGGALSNGTPGTPYSQALTGTGGTPPYNWTIIGGALPPGLSLNSGVISGTTSAVGTSTFTAQATDSARASSSAVFTITMAPLPLAVSGLPFPNGIAGASYPLQIPVASGGVGPYTFTVSSGSLPPGLSPTGGEIGGIPTSSGTFNFSLTVSDAESPAQTVTIPTQIAISPAGSQNLLLSAGSLSFNLAAGAGGLPAPGSFTVQSSGQQQLNYSVVATPAVSWLDVSGAGTATYTTPGSIAVALDPSAVNLGASSTPLATALVVTCLAPSPCAGVLQTVQVSLAVNGAAPQLIFPSTLTAFSATAALTAPLTQQVAIQNVGGGSARIVSASTADAWLTVSGVPVAVSAGPPVNITLTANPAGLTTGFYRSSVTIQSSAGTITLPVTLAISNAPALTLSSSGAQFLSTLGSAPLNTAGSLAVGVTVGVAGQTVVNWTATVLPGASWLQLSKNTTSGSANSSSPATVSYSLDTNALSTAQTYYGIIQVTAEGVANSPQNYLVVLNVAGATALPVPVPQPAGLVFHSGVGGTAPASQTVAIYSSSGSGAAYSASATTTDGNAWLNVSPATGTSSTGSLEAVSTVSVNPSKAPSAGVFTGTVSYQFAGGVVRGVNVTMIVAPASGFSAASRGENVTLGSKPNIAAGCSPTQVTATQTGLANNFAQATSWPATLSVIVADNCGAAVANAQVVETFSNGDPPLPLGLVSSGTGLYAGTWSPRATSGQVTVTATATAPGLSSGAGSVTGQVVANSAPALAPEGILHIYNPLLGGAVGQGTILQIYGSNMSASPLQASTLPLPTTLGGTSVTIGGIAAPLYYVSANQIDAQLPYELTPGNSYQAIVNNNGALSLAGSVQVTTATPGIAAFPSGQIIAQHPDTTLVSESSPAAPGEYLVIYLAGLGLTSQPVADGAAAPDSPLEIPLIAPALTLNGVGVPIYFSGLTPGFVGLYQMNFQVPANTPNGDVQLIVSQDGVAGNSTILPVHN